MARVSRTFLNHLNASIASVTSSQKGRSGRVGVDIPARISHDVALFNSNREEFFLFRTGQRGLIDLFKIRVQG